MRLAHRQYAVAAAIAATISTKPAMYATPMPSTVPSRTAVNADSSAFPGPEPRHHRERPRTARRDSGRLRVSEHVR